MTRSIRTRLLNWAFPIAPFVLEIADKLLMEPNSFLSLLNTENALKIRAVDGSLARYGVTLSWSETGDVELSTTHFPDGINLSWRERYTLREALTDWSDLIAFRMGATA